MKIVRCSLENYEEIIQLWRKSGIGIGSSDSKKEFHRMLERNPYLCLIGKIKGKITEYLSVCNLTTVVVYFYRSPFFNKKTVSQDLKILKIFAALTLITNRVSEIYNPSLRKMSI